MQIFNSKSGSLEELSRGPGRTLHLHACGPIPTPGFHLGHAMSAITLDVLVRFLRDQYGTDGVHHVVGMPDCDARVRAAAELFEEDSKTFSRNQVEVYRDFLNQLNVLLPDEFVLASDHLASVIELVEVLEGREIAYLVEGKGLYFHVPAWKQYGVFSGHLPPSEKKKEPAIEGLRDPRDFCLWELWDHEEAWDSPWGKGRPGVPIACLAGAADSLGLPLDLFAGGRNLRCHRHEQVLAQAGAAGVEDLSRYWVHHGLLLHEGRKMSRGEENVLDLGKAIEALGAGGLRHYFLGHTYRQDLTIEEEQLEAAAKAYARILDARERVEEICQRPLSPIGMNAQVSTLETDIHHARQSFTDAMEDDLNTAKAMASIHQLVRAMNKGADWVGEDNPSPQLQQVLKATVHVLDTLTRTLGFLRSDGTYLERPEPQIESSHEDRFVDLLVLLRVEARERKDFATADKIRACLEAASIELQDGGNGTRWSRR